MWKNEKERREIASAFLSTINLEERDIYVFIF